VVADDVGGEVIDVDVADDVEVVVDFGRLVTAMAPATIMITTITTTKRIVTRPIPWPIPNFKNGSSYRGVDRYLTMFARRRVGRSELS
jgi:hypothetical protein